MKTNKILSFVLVIAVAMSLVFSFAVVSEAKSAVDQNAEVSITAAVVDGYWDVYVGFSIDGDMFYTSGGRQGDNGFGVTNFEFNFNDVANADIYKAFRGNSADNKVLTLGTVGASGTKVSWNTATTNEIMYGAEPLTIVTFSTNFAEADISKEDLIAKFSNGMGVTLVQVSEFAALTGAINKGEMATIYGVDTDGATQHPDADYLLATPLNKVEEPTVEWLPITAEVEKFVGEDPSNVDYAYGINTTCAGAVQMIFAAGADEARQYSKEIAVAGATGAVNVGFVSAEELANVGVLFRDADTKDATTKIWYSLDVDNKAE